MILLSISASLGLSGCGGVGGSSSGSDSTNTTVTGSALDGTNWGYCLF